MKINAKLKVNENMDTSEIAFGWVEIEECFKFPIKIKKYIDKMDNKEKMFVSYPSKKTEDGYSDVVYPQDKNVREEVEKYVLNELVKTIKKGVELPAITDIRITVLKSAIESGTMLIRGFAAIKIAGFVIKGIMIKESEKGLFVQMPQYKVDGGYKDMVYGTNKFMQTQITNEVLYAYEKELQEQEKY